VVEEPYHLTAMASSTVCYGENVHYLHFGPQVGLHPNLTPLGWTLNFLQDKPVTQPHMQSGGSFRPTRREDCKQVV
jgi:hypothetical protein